MDWLKRTGTLESSLIHFLKYKLHFNDIWNYSNTCQEEINFLRKEKNNETCAIFTAVYLTQTMRVPYPWPLWKTA